MGAITRAAANNFTTSGVILPSAINDASVASVSSLAQVSAGDGITLISSQTASASASLSFTTGIDSTYRTYLFKFINIHPATSSDFTFNMSTDGGSSYNVTKTTTFFRGWHSEDDTSANLVYETSWDLAQSTNYHMISAQVGNDSDYSTSGTLHLYNPSSNIYVKHFTSNVSDVYNTPANMNIFTAGYGNTTSAVNAIDFKMSSGNIDSGTIHMYGIA